MSGVRYTTREVAAAIGVTPQWVLRLAARALVVGRRYGRSRTWSAADVRRIKRERER